MHFHPNNCFNIKIQNVSRLEKVSTFPLPVSHSPEVTAIPVHYHKAIQIPGCSICVLEICSSFN